VRIIINKRHLEISCVTLIQPFSIFLSYRNTWNNFQVSGNPCIKIIISTAHGTLAWSVSCRHNNTIIIVNALFSRELYFSVDLFILANKFKKRCLFFFQLRSLVEPLATSRGTPVEKPCINQIPRRYKQAVQTHLTQNRHLLTELCNERVWITLASKNHFHKNQSLLQNPNNGNNDACYYVDAPQGGNFQRSKMPASGSATAETVIQIWNTAGSYPMTLTVTQLKLYFHLAYKVKNHLKIIA
jgi:hypothetical protein